jgi:hypothetical protein
VRIAFAALLSVACHKPPPSFARDVWPVLDHHCAAAKGCHGDDPTDSVALDLRRAHAYAELVGHLSAAKKGAFRIQPNDPAASFLINKLTGALGPREGKQMPIDDMTGAPILPSPLPPGFVERTLTPWILAGAPNN